MTTNRNIKELEAVLEASFSDIARSGEARNQAALAMLTIHEGKLYKQSYRNFEAYLSARWRISRARGYQMLHFARVLRMSTGVDIRAPGNERRARALDPEGKSKVPTKVILEDRAMRYLVRCYEMLPSADRLGFVESMLELLNEMKQQSEAKR